MAIMNGRINSYHQLTIPLSIALKSTTAVNKHYMLQDLNPKSPFFFTKNMHALMTWESEPENKNVLNTY